MDGIAIPQNNDSPSFHRYDTANKEQPLKGFPSNKDPGQHHKPIDSSEKRPQDARLDYSLRVERNYVPDKGAMLAALRIVLGLPRALLKPGQEHVDASTKIISFLLAEASLHLSEDYHLWRQVRLEREYRVRDSRENEHERVLECRGRPVP
ncbi:MAG: hypothetical protein HY663_06350 [Chloroflexi bacterium]|nr:hypothetical protein [Chloroflexota bacterium]